MTNLVLNATVFLGLSFASTNALAKQETVDKQIEVPANVVVSIDNMRGKVTIVGTDNNYAKVKGKLDEYATGFTFELDGDNLTIRVEMPDRGTFSGNDATELNVRLPHTAELHVNGVSSDFDVSGFESGIRLNTVSGDIAATNLAGDIKLSTVSGDVNSKGLGGDISLKSVSGDITDRDGSANSASYASTSGDVEARTSATDISAESVSGDVGLNLQNVSRLILKSVSGDVRAQLSLAENGRVEANSVSGNVELIFTGAVNAKLDADVSGGGDIVNQLNDTKVRESEWGIGASLSTKLGSGAGNIELTTMSGDIIVRKK
ncbi:DUF4097 family beta strand repeat-containing protein [Pseudidiomarina sp. E22-M8]|uniref:DUF4097 family beta strand repeat-containing protein n=1 Tax=Pseudidiomarina sp. E22-M8 TaxID=3424768 RepID=UPI00403C78EF